MHNIPLGSFIWCNFPLEDVDNRKPAPNNRHIVYVESLENDNAVSVYTTTQIPTPLPVGSVLIPKEISLYVMQQNKPFRIDMQRIGYFPLTTEWFPDLEKDGHGIRHVATVEFQHQFTLKARKFLNEHLELVRLYGPEAPEIKTRFKP